MLINGPALLVLTSALFIIVKAALNAYL